MSGGGCTCSARERRWLDDGACATCRHNVLERQLEPVLHRALCGGTGLVLWRNPAGFDQVRNVKYGLAPGSGDYVGVWSAASCYVEAGRHVEVEIKTPLGRLSKVQLARRDLLVRLRCVYAVVRRVEDAAALISWLRCGGQVPPGVYA